VLYLCNPQNPGGTVFQRDELARLAELAAGCVIVSDEIHCDLLLDEAARHVPIASLAPEISRRTVTLMSANKAFNIPSAGCAWAVVEDPQLREAMSLDVRSHVLPSPSVFGYAATLAALREGDAWLAAQLEYLRGNRDLVARELPLPMAPVQATYLAWIDCTELPVADAHEHFLRHGVALSPGAQFGAPRFVRLNFGTQRKHWSACGRRCVPQAERRLEHALEVRVAHADVVHVLERVADVVDAGAALADALRHQPRTAMQVELAHIGGMLWIGDERERVHAPAVRQHRRDDARLVHPARHLAAPEPCERAADFVPRDAVRHAPARAAAAKPHDEPGFAVRAAVARGKDAQRAVIAVDPGEASFPVGEAGRPHERAIAEHPEILSGEHGAEVGEPHSLLPRIMPGLSTLSPGCALFATDP